MELEAPHLDSIFNLKPPYYGRATDACQTRKERVHSAGLRIQSDAFATERALIYPLFTEASGCVTDFIERIQSRRCF